MSNKNINEKPVMPNGGKNVNFGFVFFVVMLVVAGIFYLLNGRLTSYPEITYSDFITAVSSNRVIEVEIINESIVEGVMYSDTSASTTSKMFFKTIIPYNF